MTLLSKYDQKKGANVRINNIVIDEIKQLVRFKISNTKIWKDMSRKDKIGLVIEEGKEHEDQVL